MPHITIQCYPKELNEQQLEQFADDLTAFVSNKLNTPSDYITINYQEMDAKNFKEQVWDKQIEPNREQLLRKPHYEL